MKEEKRPKRDPMRAVASFIVEKRVIFYLVFLAAVIFCALSVGKVRINSDLTAFLPAEAETRRGLAVMEAEFDTYAAAQVMVSNVTYEQAEQLAGRLREIEGVTDVGFDRTAAHYADASALFSVSFDGGELDDTVLAAMEQIRQTLWGYDTYISSSVGEDFSAQLAQEMRGVILVAVLVIVAVLLFTSRSYFEVVVFLIVFAVAAVLNMGTNFLLGEISSITNSIAVILQLALAIDYAIIFCHRYQDDSARCGDVREALVSSLSKAILEISSSSLTTISGLVALTLMQFRLGYDLGVVLSKGIVCSLLTVFLLMPGLIMLFSRPLQRTLHRSLVPNIRPWGDFLGKHKYLFSAVFLLILPGAVFCSSRCEYAFSDRTVHEIVPSESRLVADKISGTFDQESTIALLVPRGDYASEQAVLKRLAELPDVKTVTGLANTEIEDGKMLTDPFTPRMFAELLDLEIEQAKLIYQVYGVSNQDYRPVFGDVADYEVPLLDLLLFLFDLGDQGVLDDAAMGEIHALRGTLERALAQLRGETWSRMVITAAVPEEGERSVGLVEQIREAAGAYYGTDQVLVVGDITSARDLRTSFSSDMQKINVLTILFVFVILLFTFRSLAGAALLVFVIQGSIWINFSFPYLSGYNISFITYLIVSAIQMGATIDYAIVIMNRYQNLRDRMQPAGAAAQAVAESFATVFTSGSIMTSAGFLIAYMTTDAYVGSIGLALGRGTLISMILVLTVLPQLILILDRPIAGTRFTLRFLKGRAET